MQPEFGEMKKKFNNVVDKADTETIQQPATRLENASGQRKIIWNHEFGEILKRPKRRPC